MEKIVVNEKALAHLSRGIYRSPGSALRELISNAWDANATEVRIDTNYPNFYTMKVEDNGDGISKSDFVKLMSGGIGNSTKRVNGKRLINDRSIIGRLGIGMLGIAQICGSFTIISNPKDGDPFRARIHLYDMLKPKLDMNDKDIVHSEDNIVFVGEYEVENYDPQNSNSGVLIYADDVHPTFMKAFSDSVDTDGFKEPPLDDWRECIRILANVHSIQELGDYWRLIWEISSSSPIPYLDESAIPEDMVKVIQTKLLSYDFNIFIDGIQLYKPVYLEGNAAGYTHIALHKKEKVFGKDLDYHGYMVVQESRQLQPDELRGIMIRIKNIAIGYYDPSFLDYRYNEGPRSRWLTGEIYVEEGLEDAINLDRDSFNTFHPHFKALQQHIHEILRKEIFPSVWKKIKTRTDEKVKKREINRNDLLKSSIEKTSNLQVNIEHKSAMGSKDDTPEVKVKKQEGELSLKLPSEDSLKIKKSNKQLAVSILGILEIALEEKEPIEIKRVFRELLLRILNKW